MFSRSIRWPAWDIVTTRSCATRSHSTARANDPVRRIANEGQPLAGERVAETCLPCADQPGLQLLCRAEWPGKHERIGLSPTGDPAHARRQSGVGQTLCRSARIVMITKHASLY